MKSAVLGLCLLLSACVVGSHRTAHRLEIEQGRRVRAMAAHAQALYDAVTATEQVNALFAVLQRELALYYAYEQEAVLNYQALRTERIPWGEAGVQDQGVRDFLRSVGAGR